MEDMNRKNVTLIVKEEQKTDILDSNNFYYNSLERHY
jgi:hypothetical protein